MKKLPCFTKPKNRGGYYFTPTVDGKTKWIPLGTDKQVALEKYHIYMQGESLRSFSKRGARPLFEWRWGYRLVQNSNTTCPNGKKWGTAGNDCPY